MESDPVIFEMAVCAYRIWKHLLDHPEPTIKAAATACKINYGTARNVVRRLKSQHLVTQEAGMLAGVPQDEPAQGAWLGAGGGAG